MNSFLANSSYITANAASWFDNAKNNLSDISQGASFDNLPLYVFSFIVIVTVLVIVFIATRGLWNVKDINSNNDKVKAATHESNKATALGVIIVIIMIVAIGITANAVFG